MKWSKITSILFIYNDFWEKQKLWRPGYCLTTKGRIQSEEDSERRLWKNHIQTEMKFLRRSPHSGSQFSNFQILTYHYEYIDWKPTYVENVPKVKKNRNLEETFDTQKFNFHFLEFKCAVAVLATAIWKISICKEKLPKNIHLILQGKNSHQRRGTTHVFHGMSFQIFIQRFFVFNNWGAAAGDCICTRNANSNLLMCVVHVYEIQACACAIALHQTHLNSMCCLFCL